MKNRGSSGGGLGAGGAGSVVCGFAGSISSGLSCGASVSRAPRFAIRSIRCFNSVFSFALGGWELHEAALEECGGALGRQDQRQADDGHDDGALGPAAAPLLGALGH